MSRLRVMVLTKTTSLGGAERLVMNTLSNLDRDAFAYRVSALDGGGPRARARQEADVACDIRRHVAALEALYRGSWSGGAPRWLPRDPPRESFT